MDKKIILLSILVIGLFLISCTKEEMFANEEIQAKLIDANSNLKSYSMDMKVDTDMKMVGENSLGETMREELEMIMDFSGDIDIENKKMGLEGTAEVSMLGENIEMGMKIYIIDNYQYTATIMEELPEGIWMKEKIEQDMWDQQDQIKETLELIKSGSIKVLDDETINGKSFYVVKVNPDLKKLVEMTLEEQEKSNLYNEDLDFEDIIRKYEATIWVNKDTYVIEKEIINMRMVMTPENIGEESDGLAELDMDMTIEAKMFDFNKAMTIELPTGAEDAMDITELEGLY